MAAALKVLCTADPHEKARRTNAIVEMWQAGRIGLPQAGMTHAPPLDRPARESTKARALNWQVFGTAVSRALSADLMRCAILFGEHAARGLLAVRHTAAASCLPLPLSGRRSSWCLLTRRPSAARAAPWPPVRPCCTRWCTLRTRRLTWLGGWGGLLSGWFCSPGSTHIVPVHIRVRP